ncbi:MAG: ferritin-like domain-containing protein [Gammaproteobacteria bacterium]|nr:MAG: ferritin-like domain-containing protein [Gammaproteobacteria bacterium]
MEMTMKNDIVTVLTDLAQLDIDAVCAYEQALEKIEEKTIYQSIDSFRNDHLRHIDDLSEMIKNYGGTPPERSKDFKGFIIEGFTALRSITGTRGALRAMEFNEKTTNKNYKKALTENADFPPEVIALLQKNYGDEQRHLNYIQVTLQKWNVERTV